jgi:PAS domain S-box-containing protein
LHKAIKSFKDGNFSFESQVYSEDEIGELYKEFKNMSDKIVEFKNSTLGQLVEEKNKSLSIVKSISNPLIVLDSNFKCILVNNSCENYFNIEEQNILGEHILNFIPNKDLYDFIYESKKERVQGKTKIMSFDEEKYVFNISISTIISMNSDLNGIIIYFQDITKIKKLDHVKFDFISTLSHELKTPLTSIMMGASMLEEDSIIKNKEESGKIIETLQEDSQKLLDMIDNLLRLTELENEQNYLNLETTDISEIINNSIRNFITIALSKNIKIIFEKDKNIPLLNIDREKFFWVINNLLSNAIKYSLQYGDIIIKLKYRKKVVILTIKDFGIGISPESIPKIFDKFYRENELSNGTGLGLPLSKQIIELHNGTISCESKLGEGSIFEVNIPITGGNL